MPREAAFRYSTKQISILDAKLLLLGLGIFVRHLTGALLRLD